MTDPIDIACTVVDGAGRMGFPCLILVSCRPQATRVPDREPVVLRFLPGEGPVARNDAPVIPVNFK
jgi:hypothetical protein